MPEFDLYEAYKRVVATTRDEVICWWYSGIISAQLDDGLDIPCTGCQTLMAFKVQHLSPTSLRIDWLETCLLRDLETGELNPYFDNPLTGRRAPLASTFYDGPVTYFVSKNGDGVDLRIVQHEAEILSTSVSATVSNGRILFRQGEEKRRAFAQQSSGGDKEAGVHLQTELLFAADLADATNPASENVAASGYYDAAIAGMISKWMDFSPRTGHSRVKGVMRKARADEIVSPKSWAIFREHFPDFFDGDRVSPKEWRI